MTHKQLQTEVNRHKQRKCGCRLVRRIDDGKPVGRLVRACQVSGTVEHLELEQNVAILRSHQEVSK